jgi:hypothetical protein
MLFGDEHVKRYRETDGAEGHEWQGAHCLILTTTGRTSGQERDMALIYRRHGDDHVVVASKGGAPEHPLMTEEWPAYNGYQQKTERQIPLVVLERA